MANKATSIPDYAKVIKKDQSTIKKCKKYTDITENLPVYVFREVSQEFLRVGTKFQNVIVEETE